MIEAVASSRLMLDEFPWVDRYRVNATSDVLTPALVVYPEVVEANIDLTLRLLGGDAERWRPHIKTSKLAYTLQMLVARGVGNFKCATTLELLLGCRSGAKDVLFAYPAVGATARRVQEIASEFPNVRISVLAENPEQVRQWHGSRVGIYLDINPGMNRTGIEQCRTDAIVELAGAIFHAGLEFRGLHYYDGQYAASESQDRVAAAHAGYDCLLGLEGEIRKSGVQVPEIITAGTPTFPCSLAHDGFRGREFIHRVSPGTIVYGDATSLAQLPSEYGYAPGVLVLTRVVSRPCETVVTCDAGHKAVSADAGVPTCIVVGYSELIPRTPSEEHLPLTTLSGAGGPALGQVLYLLPRHVCPTVNNFDDALLVRDGSIESIEKVSARGREAPVRTAPQ